MVANVENETGLIFRTMMLSPGLEMSADFRPTVEMAMDIICMIDMDRFYMAFHCLTPNPIDD